MSETETKQTIYSVDSVIHHAAMVAHEANRSWCLLHGDTSQPHWEEATQDIRDSAIAGVRKVMEGVTTEELHIAWCEHKQAQGWRWGPLKDAEQKEHPCLVLYKDLPKDQRAKDGLFMASVRAVLDRFVVHPDSSLRLYDTAGGPAGF